MAKYLIGCDDGHGMETLGKRTPALKGKLNFRGKEFKKGSTIRENDFNENLMEMFIKGCKRCGLDGIQLAPGDSDVPLATRVSKANSKGCDILVSFHANALSGEKWQTKAHGLVVIRHEVCQSKTKTLANNIYKYLSDDKEVDWYKDGGTKYGVREDTDISGISLYILSRSKMPAVLVEYGFMDHWEDVKRMVKPSFQKSCVEATLKGVCETLGVPYKPLDNESNTNTSKPPTKPSNGEFKVRIICDELNVRSNPSVKYPIVGEVKKGEAFSIVDVVNNWGKLKSGLGWISLGEKYVMKL